MSGSLSCQRGPPQTGTPLRSSTVVEMAWASVTVTHVLLNGLKPGKPDTLTYVIKVPVLSVITCCSPSCPGHTWQRLYLPAKLEHTSISLVESQVGGAMLYVMHLGRHWQEGIRPRDQLITAISKCYKATRYWIFQEPLDIFHCWYCF